MGDKCGCETQNHGTKVVIDLGFTKHMYRCVLIINNTSRSFVYDGGHMTDFVRPQVGFYCTGILMM